MPPKRVPSFGVFYRETEVLVFDHLDGLREADVEREEGGFRVGVAEGAELFERGEEVGSDFGEAEFGVALDLVEAGFLARGFVCVVGERGAELRDVR